MKPYKQLYIFVEGPDDERFINAIIKPECNVKYSYVKIIRYANRVPSEIYKLIATIKKQEASDYIFMCDMDARGDKTICIKKRKEKENSKFSNILDADRIVVVREEIESWYIAGVISSILAKLKIKKYTNTDELTKEEFVRLMPNKRFDSVSDFMIELLKEFSLEQAMEVNTSLEYFFRKHVKHHVS